MYQSQGYLKDDEYDGLVMSEVAWVIRATPDQRK